MLSRSTRRWLSAPVASVPSQRGRGAAKVELTVGKVKESELLGFIEVYGRANELDVTVTRQAHLLTTTISLDISGDRVAIKKLDEILRREADSSVLLSWP
jgi:hypothetical protein